METSVVEVGGKEEFKEYQETIKEALFLALSYLQIENSFIDVNLVSSDEIKELNNTYAGKNAPTNVLSFEEEGLILWDDRELNHLGEIYLSPEEIKDRNENIVYLAIHGCLHLLGLNHKNDDEAKEMERVESEIMKIISDLS